MRPSEFKHWCAGKGTDPCGKCGFYKNWLTSLQLPAELRLSLRSNLMSKIEDCGKPSFRYFNPNP
jgi:hypothetical protein